MELNDKLIAIAIVAFVLSQITERINNLFKLYLPAKWFGNLKVKEDQELFEKKRERKILILSLVSGILVAITTFYPLSESEFPASLMWLGKYTKSPLFYLLLGIFLSFGSKFWHDLLDILLEIKNLRKKLVDEKTYQVETTKELMAKLQITEGEIARKALEQNKTKLIAIPGCVGLSISYADKNSAAVEIQIDQDKNNKNIPDFIYYVDDYGTAYKVTLFVTVTDIADAHQCTIGGAIANRKTPAKTGSLGYYFKDKYNEIYYGLTCYHVLKTKHQWNFLQPIQEEDIIDVRDNSSIGTLIYGKRNKYFDVALTQLNSKPSTDTLNLKLAGVKTITDIDAKNQTEVFILGKVTGKPKKAVVISSSSNKAIRYSDGSIQNFSDLIKIGAPLGDPSISPTTYGDSGAILYDKNNAAVGIIIGGDKLYSYAMKISEIEKDLAIQLLI